MLSKRLRAETADHHRSLESLLDLTRPGFTKDAYRHLLERFYGFHVPFEAAAAPVLDAFLPGYFPARMKSPLLAADLVAMGVRDLDALPRCSSLPPADSFERILGACYVIEGATLGGQILSRHFSSALGLTGPGCSFFAAYGKDVPAMWRSFLAILDEPRSSGAADAVVASAKDTFEAMHRWMSEVPVS